MYDVDSRCFIGMIILNSSDENFKLVRILTRKSNCHANLRTRQKRISQELQQLSCYTGLVHTHLYFSSSRSERFPRENEVAFHQENSKMLKLNALSDCYAICYFKLQHHIVGKFKEKYFLQSLDTTWSSKHNYIYVRMKHNVFVFCLWTDVSQRDASPSRSRLSTRKQQQEPIQKTLRLWVVPAIYSYPEVQ